jgi:hypothetical protein
MSKKLDPVAGHTVLLHKNGTLRKLTDFILFHIHVAFSFNSNSHTLVLYHIDTGNVTLYSLDELGQMQRCSVLHLNDRSKKPSSVKSLALTVAQDLLILIDYNSTVYELDISKENDVYHYCLKLEIISMINKTSLLIMVIFTKQSRQSEKKILFFSFKQNLVLILLIKITVKYIVLH